MRQRDVKRGFGREVFTGIPEQACWRRGPAPEITPISFKNTVTSCLRRGYENIAYNKTTKKNDKPKYIADRWRKPTYPSSAFLKHSPTLCKHAHKKQTNRHTYIQPLGYGFACSLRSHVVTYQRHNKLSLVTHYLLTAINPTHPELPWAKG